MAGKEYHSDVPLPIRYSHLSRVKKWVEYARAM